MADNPEDDFLESSTADPSMTLGEAAYATGAIGSSFAPGAGVADVMGYAPDPFNPGQMLPSFSENVAQGNYIDAGIQTLGLAGDAFYAAAPFTAGIAALPGGVLKGAQALAKTLRGGTIPNPKTTTPQVFFPDLGEKSHVTLQPDVKNDAVSIMYIEADKPGQGQGGEMLRRVTEQADATGTRLTLYPDPRGEGGLDQDELIEFYQRNGFEFQYPDPTNPDPILDMVREPRPPVQSSTLYRSEAQSYESPNEGAVFYTPDKSYAELYASEDRVFRETSLPANVFDIREPGNSEAVLNWVDQKISNLEDISGVSVDIRDVYAGIEQGGPQGASRALAAYNTILAKQADRSIIPGQAEKMFMQDFGIDAMTIKEAGRDLDEYSVAFKDAPRPTDPTSGSLSDLSTPELITSWVIEPSKVDRAEVASRLLSQPDVVSRSNQALDTLGYGDTVPMFRLVKLTNDGDLQPEGLISATLDPNKVPSNIKFLTQGKFGMTTPTDYRLVRYDVPREKIAGYLPAVSDDIKRTVNRAVKEKGFGQDNVPGMTTVTNPAKYAKELIDLQDEIIADVSGLKPTVLVDDSGRPMNMLSMGGALPKLIAEGRVTTPEDISEILPNYFALNPMEYARQGNDIPFEVAEKQAREALISRYQDFFGIQNKAEGGVITLADVARNMNRGPRGVGSLAPIARNMYRTMVS